MADVTHKQLELLNGWPAGTHGYVRDAELLYALNVLCIEHGYGLVPQMAAWIAELWHNQEGTFEKFEAMRAERLVYAEEARVAHHGSPEEKASLFNTKPTGG